MNKTQKKIYNWLKSKPGYINCSAKIIQIAGNTTFGYQTINDVEVSLKQARSDEKLQGSIISPKQTKSVLKATKSTKKVVNVTLKPIKKKFKRLFFDIETSYNVVSSWRVGYKLNIGPENILKERAIICVSWKFAGESKVHSLKWDKGCDKQLLIDFLKVFDSASEVIGQNSDKFDIRWLRTRCIFHNVPMMPEYNSVDTLKLARAGFNFNSNKLAYLGSFLGVGTKMNTGGFKLWQDIIMDNCPKAMGIMIKYCEQDVKVLEKVYNKLNPYSKHKTHVAVFLGGDKCDCANCGSKNTVCNMTRTTAAGITKKQMHCKDCGKSHSVNITTYLKERK